MKILVISNSARGEAIIDALKRSPKNPEIVCISTVKSPGLLSRCSSVECMDIMSLSKVVEKAKALKPDFAFIAPDDPIGAGLADRLESNGIPCIAPKKSLARIESSKSFARTLLEKYAPGASPRFESFILPSLSEKKAAAEKIRSFIAGELKGHFVVKYDGLRGGKGVKVSGDHLPTVESGVQYALECLQDCGTVVIEEKLVGVEFSLMSFVSGEVCIDMPAVQDHKRAYAGDTGPNTGGMGTYSDANHSLPFLTEKELSEASRLNATVAKGLKAECKEAYKGILYGGFIATKNGVKVIEYNARFGDPEALNVLPLLESDFVDICEGMIDGSLTPSMVSFAKKATVCKYITPKSYPEDKKERGQVVSVPDMANENCKVYYGDVSIDEGGKVLLGGSRSVGVVGLGATLAEAEQVAQIACEQVSGPIRFRSDIGTNESIQKKIEFMNKVRQG